ncbi:MAG TPA: hypothetical protein DDY79_09045, partial [Brevundimonas sp.]|nr:hypothetical protein [Brevundimonas sp.]
MSRKPASFIVAAQSLVMALIMALAVTPALTTQAAAQSRDQDPRSQDRGPRVSPDEARRRGGEA